MSNVCTAGVHIKSLYFDMQSSIKDSENSAVWCECAVEVIHPCLENKDQCFICWGLLCPQKEQAIPSSL